jgi:hypothetical protein
MQLSDQAALLEVTVIDVKLNDKRCELTRVRMRTSHPVDTIGGLKDMEMH